MNNLLKVHTLAVIECIGPSYISDDVRSYIIYTRWECRLFCDPGNT